MTSGGNGRAADLAAWERLGAAAQPETAAREPAVSGLGMAKRKGMKTRLGADREAEVARRRIAGEAVTALAEVYGVSPSTISNICRAAGARPPKPDPEAQRARRRAARRDYDAKRARSYGWSQAEYRTLSSLAHRKIPPTVGEALAALPGRTETAIRHAITHYGLPPLFQRDATAAAQAARESAPDFTPNRDADLVRACLAQGGLPRLAQDDSGRVLPALVTIDGRPWRHISAGRKAAA